MPNGQGLGHGHDKKTQKTSFHAKTHSNTKNVQNCHWTHCAKIRLNKKTCNIAPPNIKIYL
jgi:hypothetical protein